jgi:uncharacterized protein (TIGR03437 family)
MVCAGLAHSAQPLYTIETAAGSSWTGDGRSAKSALLLQPQSVAVDRSGNVYISDAGDHRVRRVSPSGVIQTVAGTGTPGSQGDGGPGGQAQLNAPYGLAFDTTGNLFIADLGNALVRRLGLDGNLITVAGGGREVPSEANPVYAARAKLIQPRDLAVDRYNNLFIADFGAHRVYKVTIDGTLSVVAGTGTPGTIIAPTPALQAPLSFPSALTIDSTGTLFIADSGNRRIRRLANGVLSTLLDNSSKEVELGTPTGLATDTSGRLYIADGSSRITVLSAAGELSSLPFGGTSVAIGNIFEVFVTGERQVKRFSGSQVEVLAGVGETTSGSGDGSRSADWRFSSPSAILRDIGGYLYVADSGSGRVRRLSPYGELVTLTTAIQKPVSLAADSKGMIYVGDSATGSVFRLEGLNPPKIVVGSDSRPIEPSALAFDAADNLYIADAVNGLIRRVTPAGTMTVVAGGGNQTEDGTALLQKLSNPAGLAFAADGTLWFSEAGSGRIRKLIDGEVITLPGTELKEPRGIRLTKSGELWVADAGAHRIVKIAPSGEWMPVAGSGDRGFGGDGDIALAAMLSAPGDVLPEPDGTVLVADTGNNRIRRLKPPVLPSDPQPGPGTTPDNTQPVTVIHAATMQEGFAAPGQLVYLTAHDLLNPHVSIGGIAATVISADAKMLIVQVPPSVSAGSAEIAVQSENQSAGKAEVKIVTSAPGILTAGGGKGQALALNGDGSPNSVDNPVGRGAVVSFFLTGQGSGFSAITAEIGLYPAEVLWSGPAPGLTGVFQVNVRTPGGFSPSGIVPVTLRFDGAATQSGVTISSR